MTVSADEFFSASVPETEPEHPMRQRLINMIQRRHDSTPRHLQVELGPSEVGTPCMRKLAYGLMDVERCNPEWDPLPSINGVAMHTWLQGAAQLDNAILGYERWIIESRVEVTPGLSGSADLYDTLTGTVIDWKNPGPTRFKIYAKGLPPVIYRRQVHLYGRGFQRLGYEVKHVAIAFLPAGGHLRKMKYWTEPYSDRIADEALIKRDQVIALLDDFDIDNHPERYEWFPKEPDSDCIFCANFHAKPLNSLQCPGGMDQKK